MGSPVSGQASRAFFSVYAGAGLGTEPAREGLRRLVPSLPEYLCLVEVWHLRRGNVVHQAEGPRPRTIPTPEAWYWLGEWCKQERLDLSEWECYS